MATYEEQLLEREKTLAGFHKDHYIRDSLIAQIEILKVKALAERAELADTRTLEERILEQQKTLAGFHPQHYIRQSIEAKIEKLQERIIQKKTRN